MPGIQLLQGGRGSNSLYHYLKSVCGGGDVSFNLKKCAWIFRKRMKLNLNEITFRASSKS